MNEQGQIIDPHLSLCVLNPKLHDASETIPQQAFPERETILLAALRWYAAGNQDDGMQARMALAIAG